MTHDRFHLVLTVSLAGLVGFGAAHLLSSGDAVAYPTGPAVSYGANPVRSFGGSVAWGDTATLTPSASGQDFVITDAVFTVGSTENGCNYSHGYVSIADSTQTLAEFALWMYRDVHTTDAGHSFASGLRIPEGDSVTLEATEYWSELTAGDCTGSNMPAVHYAISGYYAEP